MMEITPELRRSKIAPAVFAGPFIGLNTSAQFQQSGFAEDVKVPGDFNAADSVKSTDFGVTFGGGLGYKLTTESEIFFDIRYDFGLTKILKSGVLNHPDAQADTKTSALLVTAGYRFGL